VLYTSVPTDGSDSAAFMEVRFSRLEALRLLNVRGDILDEYLRATTSKEILLVRVKFKSTDRYVRVNRLS
jgi:hypothetical protein